MSICWFDRRQDAPVRRNDFGVRDMQERERELKRDAGAPNGKVHSHSNHPPRR